MQSNIIDHSNLMTLSIKNIFNFLIYDFKYVEIKSTPPNLEYMANDTWLCFANYNKFMSKRSCFPININSFPKKINPKSHAVKHHRSFHLDDSAHKKQI